MEAGEGWIHGERQITQEERAAKKTWNLQEITMPARDFPPRLMPAPVAAQKGEMMTFQWRVDRWLIACFGEKIARDKTERNHRFLEESLELVQACGCTKDEALQLVDYVYGREVGEINQEVGGVMNTLAALCLAQKIDMIQAGHVELDRCWMKVEKIRAKQAAKPNFSPLPQ